MSLTLTEKYVAKNTLFLYNKILNVSFYRLFLKGNNVLVSWDENNFTILNLFGPGNYTESDVKDLEGIILHFISINDLTSDN
jgi:hypothetical protein